MTFHSRIEELLSAADTHREFAESVDETGLQYLEQFASWPCSTQVPLGRVAYIIAFLVREPDPHVRRRLAQDFVKITEALG